jgi:tetratricopeptide (TPR) repeat protein
MSGREEEAAERARLALQLDPLSPTGTVWAGAVLALAGRIDEGLTAIEMQVKMTPHLWMPRYWYSLILALGARPEEARTEAQKALELSGENSLSLSHLAGIAFRVGDKGSGHDLLARLQERAKARFVGRMLLSWAHIAAGESEAALRYAEEALEAKDPWVIAHPWICSAIAASDPRVDDLIRPALP